MDWRIVYGSEMYRNQIPDILSQRRPRWNSGGNILCPRDTEKVIKQDDVYKIQTVQKKRRKGRRVQYLVKWLGYSESFNSWIFKQDLHFCTKARRRGLKCQSCKWHRMTRTAHRLGSSLEKKIPRSEIVFLCQVLILYTVFVVSIYNLTAESENSTLWTALLSSCLGYLLSNPTIKSKHVLSDITQ